MNSEALDSNMQSNQKLPKSNEWPLCMIDSTFGALGNKIHKTQFLAHNC